jgi:hypothetical protein
MTTCTQVYDMTRVGKATVKVRDIHSHPRESHGRRSRADNTDHLIPYHIWGRSITGVHCTIFEVSFLCSILECLHQHWPCTHNIRNCRISGWPRGGVNRPAKIALNFCQIQPMALPSQNSGTTTPADNFKAQFKIYERKHRLEKLLSFLRVCGSQIDS